MKRALCAILVVLAAAILSGVFLFSESASPANTLRVGYIPVTHCIPLFIAADRDLFEKEGLEVELIPLPGGPQILEAVSSGDIHVGFSNVVSVLLAQSEGIPMLAISGGPVETAGNKDHAILVRADSDIKNGRDLKGRKIAINSLRNIDHLMLLLYLRKNELTEDDVTFLEVPFPRMISTLDSGQADAIAAIEPFVAIGMDTSRFRLLDWNYQAVRSKTFVSTYATMESFSFENPHLIESFARVIAKASQIANEDPAAARRAIGQFTKTPAEVATKVGLPYFAPAIDAANLEETRQLMREVGLLRK